MPPIRKSDESWACNNPQKENIFVEHLETRFYSNDGANALPRLNTNDYFDKIALVTAKEVCNEIKNNHKTKKTGFDFVTRDSEKIFL